MISACDNINSLISQLISIFLNVCNKARCQELFCVDSDQKNQTQFRYSQNQRRKETKVKRYRNILQELKTNTIIDERRVEEWEAQMSSFNKKTLDFNMFKVYIKHKNELNKRLAPFYNR